jgi:NhaP-type Na+/H+ or K+/H+ antiporter
VAPGTGGFRPYRCHKPVAPAHSVIQPERYPVEGRALLLAVSGQCACQLVGAPRATLASALAGVSWHGGGMPAYRRIGLCGTFSLRSGGHAGPGTAVQCVDRGHRSGDDIGAPPKIGLPKNLETLVDGESLLNDGVAVVLFTIFAASAISGGDASLADASSIFVREVLGGGAMGLAGWLVIHCLMLRTSTYCTSLLVSLVAVACMYAAAQHLDISGPIATVVAGLLTGNITVSRLDQTTFAPLQVFCTGLDEVLNALLFVFVGFHVVLINPLQGVVPGVRGLVAVTAVLFARARTVFTIVCGLHKASVIRADCLGLTKLLTWGGLRGGLSLALAVSLPDNHLKPLILNITFAVVVFSIIVQGLTFQRMFTQERLASLLR